jgi:glutathione S-transferase
MHRFLAIPYSPWSEKARWALDLRGVPRREVAYSPFLGEAALRVRLRRFSGKITVPVLFTEDGRALGDSFEIARFAEEVGRGATLFPAGREAEIARWNARSEEILRAGRALSVAKAMDEPAAREEALPRGVPGALRPLMGRAGVALLRAKYGLGLDREAEVKIIVEGLREWRAALGGRRYLGDALSYAEVTMAVSLQLAAPVADAYIRLGRATRRVCTHEPIVKEYADLVAWRDALYAEHRRSVGPPAA